jgi:hypothetical protein
MREYKHLSALLTVMTISLSLKSQVATMPFSVLCCCQYLPSAIITSSASGFLEIIDAQSNQIVNIRPQGAPNHHCLWR